MILYKQASGDLSYACEQKWKEIFNQVKDSSSSTKENSAGGKKRVGWSQGRDTCSDGQLLVRTKEVYNTGWKSGQFRKRRREHNQQRVERMI